MQSLKPMMPLKITTLLELLDLRGIWISNFLALLQNQLMEAICSHSKERKVGIVWITNIKGCPINTSRCP